MSSRVDYRTIPSLSDQSRGLRPLLGRSVRRPRPSWWVHCWHARLIGACVTNTTSERQRKVGMVTDCAHHSNNYLSWLILDGETTLAIGDFQCVHHAGSRIIICNPNTSINPFLSMAIIFASRIDVWLNSLRAILLSSGLGHYV